ncbi:MAG TPA: CDGSH iron-sulfur domain-containing protein [Ignavibacteriales bacterium]|nr:CDGSH iron-sulfur domain-containing protein [Ignavibacteriales bacterium]HOL81902.1 CDGSH iron-sulfur domain-containing protein [Ignavibacteriales bacterium]HOM65974.1 CDGSH iron-sulfur domain-containing protein [Ignavibacteriales bacterium]HPD67506.1 CDGSH iron-sulfur domain-containing protein [Ignavibacteriales bacterium]HPP34039.1 CDGSH iron-sulfur domain-containing protein [Ignavibacteriales bacterium]
MNIELKENGPILITGETITKIEDGKETPVEQKTIAICRCGGTKNSPFCDGTHRKIEFKAPANKFEVK